MDSSTRSHLGVELGNGIIEAVHAIKVHPCQVGVVLVEAPDKLSSTSSGIFGRMRVRAISASKTGHVLLRQ